MLSSTVGYLAGMTAGTAPPPPAAVSGPPPAFEPDPGWVAVDRRWLGIDRSSIPSALVVFALAVAMVIVLPTADDETGYREQAAAGDVMQVGDGITFAPEPGWGIEAGVRRGDRPATGYPDVATLIEGDASLTITAVDFDGDANDLLTSLEQSQGVDDTSADNRVTVLTEEGHPGVSVEVADTVSQQLLAAFVFDGTGVQVVATTPPAATNTDLDAVARMMSSISADSGAQR